MSPRHQEAHPEEWPKKVYKKAEINREFKKQPNLNLGLVLGPRSYIDIEVDRAGGNEAILDLFDGDVPVTPTWDSKRGPHRLFCWHPDLDQIGKADFKMGPLEIRIGANGKGAQSLLPPSMTEDITRSWKVPIWECPPAPLADAVIDRLLLAAIEKPKNGGGGRKEESMGTQRTQIPHEISVCSVSSVYPSEHTPPTSPRKSSENDVTERVKRAIAITAPTASGVRHRSLFTFARHLKSIPVLADASMDTLRPYVEWWHEVALPAITTKAFEETWFDFRNAWGAVRYAVGKDPLSIMYTNAIAQPLPRCAEKYSQPQLRSLVALCRELQREAGGDPFYLAGRNAAQLIGVDHKTAARWLRMLCMDEVLKLDERGTRHQASEYVYLGD
ncbi:MAG: bifunctional DNA primase/polymerase [Pirellulales bacterium]